jgi:hypothetical protein
MADIVRGFSSAQLLSLMCLGFRHLYWCLLTCVSFSYSLVVVYIYGVGFVLPSLFHMFNLSVFIF